MYSLCRTSRRTVTKTDASKQAKVLALPKSRRIFTSSNTFKGYLLVLFGCIAWGASSFADDAFSSTSNNPLSLVASPNTLAKQAATYNACEANKADALLGAKYKLDTMDFVVFKTVKCTATGYPGVIKGVKAE